ncbi:MAG: hypothetical protein O8C64_10300 [Candidatus Methanoperedens sp.]|nr:hypothetical protein [Candidatus Methanoperedens sp.]MCZ7403909.1 hypothetical protein [Candidatus Methanoperedens sp.]
MNILDENIIESQIQLLRSWRIKPHRIGNEIGSPGMKDEAILTLLHQLRCATFFTRDLGFYENNFCHPNYCIVSLTVGQNEVASFIRRFLKHPTFGTQNKRKGKVVRVTHIGMRIWQLHAEKEEELVW